MYYREGKYLATTARAHYDQGEDLGRPTTNGSLAEGSSQQFGTGSNPELASAAGRTASRGSQATRQSLANLMSREQSIAGSQRSLVSQGSQRELNMPVEVTVEQW